MLRERYSIDFSVQPAIRPQNWFNVAKLPHMLPQTSPPTTPRTLVLTAVAMLAFAANSLLCRLALRGLHIDALSFGCIRLLAGAITLALVLHWRAQPAAPIAPAAPAKPAKPDQWAAAMLFGYVTFFSYAYLSLSAGSGALILFGAVQLTMIGAGLRAGERFSPVAWAGVLAATAGLAWLVAPGVQAPPLVGALAMALAGVAWGVYSLRGRGVADALAATSRSFNRATLWALGLGAVLAVVQPGQTHADMAGVALAVGSGAVASGLGYVVWYAALRGLAAMQAASVQLSVPLLAALGGVLLLDEAITLRLAFATPVILGGIALALVKRQPKSA